MIAKVQAYIRFANANGWDTTKMQAAVADLSEIANWTTSDQTLQTMEGSTPTKISGFADYSEINQFRWTSGDSRGYRVALRDSYWQLKQIYDDFKAAHAQ